MSKRTKENKITREEITRKAKAEFKKQQGRALAEMKKARKQLQNAERKVQDYIKKNPVQSTLIATTVASAIATAVSFAMKKRK